MHRLWVHLPAKLPSMVYSILHSILTIFAVFSKVERGEAVFYSLVKYEKGSLRDSLTFINQQRGLRLYKSHVGRHHGDYTRPQSLDDSGNDDSLAAFQGGDWTVLNTVQ